MSFSENTSTSHLSQINAEKFPSKSQSRIECFSVAENQVISLAKFCVFCIKQSLLCNCDGVVWIYLERDFETGLSQVYMGLGGVLLVKCDLVV